MSPSPEQPLTRLHERLPDQETLDYFNGVLEDGRIDRAIERGERTTSFAFSAISHRTIHPNFLVPNQLSDDSDHFVSSYDIKGRITEANRMSDLQLDFTNHGGERPQNITIVRSEAGPITLFNNLSIDFEQLTQKQFADISLRSANFGSTIGVRKCIQDLAALERPDFNTGLNIFWSELAQRQGGIRETVGVVEDVIATSDTTVTEVRLAQKERDLVGINELDIIIEFAEQSIQADAERVHRLELSYISDGIHALDMNAVRRSVSGCDRHLVRSRLLSTDVRGIVTELDMADPNIMRQFKVALELLLSR